jgi:outer membrane protein
MKTLRESIAVLCVLLSLSAPLSFGQQSTTAVGSGGVKTSLDKNFNWLTKNYKERTITPVRLQNSLRLDSLIRAGKIYLSLQDAISLALENNLDIEIQRYGPELAKYDIMRAEAGGAIRGVQQNVTQGASSAVNLVTGGAGGGGGGGGNAGGTGGGGNTGTVFTVTGAAIPNLDPQFTSSYFHNKQSQPQTNSFVSGLTALVVSSDSFNTGISKQFLTGTSMQATYASNSISTNSPNNDLNPFTRSNVQVQISQRLLQGFGIAVNNRNIRVAKNNMKVTDLTFKAQVIATVGSVINLYWDLVSFNEDVKVKQKAVDSAAKLFEDNKKQVEIGTLAPIEIVRAEAEVARTQQDLTVSETQLLQQEAIIKNSLSRTGIASGLVADARIIPTDQIRIPAQEAIKLQELTEEALAKRPELEQTRINVENTKIGLRGAKSQLLPSLDVVASATNNGLSGSVNDLPAPGGRLRQVDPFFVGGYGGALAQLARRNFPDYSVGFQLNVPLRNRAAQADIANDTLRLRQQELQEQRQLNSVRLEVTNAVIGLQQARARHEAAVKSRRLQEQTVEAEQKKYALGSSTIFLVIQAQRDLAQAQGVEVSALANYSRARNQLDNVTGRLLEVNQVSLDEALKGQVSRVSVIP